jgi:hypothetical protein
MKWKACWRYYTNTEKNHEISVRWSVHRALFQSDTFWIRCHDTATVTSVHMLLCKPIAVPLCCSVAYRNLSVMCSIYILCKGVHKNGTVLEDAVESHRTAKGPGNGRLFGISRVWARLIATLWQLPRNSYCETDFLGHKEGCQKPCDTKFKRCGADLGDRDILVGLDIPGFGSRQWHFVSKTSRQLWVPPKLKNSVALVRERTIPTERPPPVGEVSASFCG